MDLQAQVDDLRALALRALRRMYRPQERIFAFRLRRGPQGDVLEGISHRYTAIVLIALAEEPPEAAAAILGDETVDALCRRLIDDAQRTEDLGEAALTLWAARVHRHPETQRALARLQSMAPERSFFPTVEVAWSLSSLVVLSEAPTDSKLADAIAHRLMRTFRRESDLFGHHPADAPVSRLRAHVCCYADLVYPIQALSFYHRATDAVEAADLARRCGSRMCALQGPEGQWWWHYDVRTGRMLEKFPVYAIHQDAMGPMALFDLQECCGPDHMQAIRSSMAWLDRAPEIGGSLVDRQADVIWRKVARHEPGKLVRNLQAGLSGVHSAIRLPAANLFFPPGYIDFESRPYHMGWMLYAWNPARLQRLWGSVAVRTGES
jgi:hypothetical protein